MLAARDWVLGLMVSNSMGASQFKQGRDPSAASLNAILVSRPGLGYYYITFN